MHTSSLPIRRTLTVVAAVAALLLGFTAIRAASAWTAEAAPLVANPVSAVSIEVEAGRRAGALRRTPGPPDRDHEPDRRHGGRPAGRAGSHHRRRRARGAADKRPREREGEAQDP